MNLTESKFRIRRRGVAAVLAMLYLILFSVLAVGFYASTTTAVQVVHNEQRTSTALLCAESGMDFIRYNLAQVTVPPRTPLESLFDTIASGLQDRINNTGNATSIYVDTINHKINIPAGTNTFVPLDSSGSRGFRVQISLEGQNLVVKSIGKEGGTTLASARAVQLDYGLKEKKSRVFDFGVATKGQLFTYGSSVITGATDPMKGSILSTYYDEDNPTAVSVNIQGESVSGEITITNPDGQIVFKNGVSIGGESNPNIITTEKLHKVEPDDAPEFPTVDATPFEPFVKNTWYDGIEKAGPVINCRIPAGTQAKFAANTVIQGVLYLETPSSIEFTGGVTIQGVIVVQNDPTGYPGLTAGANYIKASGSVASSPVSTLPESIALTNTGLDLRKLTGSFILAPNYAVDLRGNFGTINGSIIASQVSMTGSATGTVQGSVVALDPMPMTLQGNSEIVIASTGTTKYPSGVIFSKHYVPLGDTYKEVKP